MHKIVQDYREGLLFSCSIRPHTALASYSVYNSNNITRSQPIISLLCCLSHQPFILHHEHHQLTFTQLRSIVGVLSGSCHHVISWCCYVRCISFSSNDPKTPWWLPRITYQCRYQGILEILRWPVLTCTRLHRVDGATPELRRQQRSQHQSQQYQSTWENMEAHMNTGTYIEMEAIKPGNRAGQ